MNKEKIIQAVLERNKYQNTYFDKQVGDNVYYFRTENIVYDFVIKVAVQDGSIDIYQADEDLHEKREAESYDYELKESFSFGEIDNMNLFMG